MHAIYYIDEHPIENETVLLRVDFNLSLRPDHTIIDDERIKQALPTITALLKSHNKLILVTHLGRPTGPDESLSVKPIVNQLQAYIPKNQITFIPDFLKDPTVATETLKDTDLIFLENIRFYKEEEQNDPQFTKILASLASVYVNDAFSVSHRDTASIVGVTKTLPSFGGLLLKKEISMLTKLLINPQKPFVAILGGSKISTKLKLISKLTTIADHVLLAGGLANTLFLAEGLEVGKSIGEKDEAGHIQNLVKLAEKSETQLVLPADVVVGTPTENASRTVSVTAITKDDQILDIGPETQAIFGEYIAQAKTIVWNGPVGYIENPVFGRGTDFIYYAITQNQEAFSVVGGGETLTALHNKSFLDRITHISTAGGAMLEFIENGTLPGLEALKNSLLKASMSY